MCWFPRSPARRGCARGRDPARVRPTGARSSAGSRICRGSGTPPATAETASSSQGSTASSWPNSWPGKRPWRAWRSHGRIGLAINTPAFLTPAATPTASFDHNQLYQFKIDNTGDAREDKVIQITFSGSGTSQTVQVRGPVAPPVPGAMANTVTTIDPAVTGKINTNLGSATGMQVFAGPRDDSFFLDLEQF